jgi:predicted enzyme related to lactoylglutathione lyase
MSTPTALLFVSLQASQPEISYQFYTETLGFERDMNYAHACVFRHSSGAIFAIRPAVAQLSVQPGAGISLWFAVQDIDAYYMELSKKGIPIKQELQSTPFGRIFVISDPDNYLITFQQARL